MSSVVELTPGDVLILRRMNANPPFEGEIESLAKLAADLELAGVLVLGPDETIESKSLAELGLVRCWHESATGADQDDGPDKVWICDACGWRHRTITEAGITRPVPA